MTFHEAVSQLQLREEEVLDAHKALLVETRLWQERDTHLLSMTRNVDYDQDGELSLRSLAAYSVLPILYTILFIWLNQNPDNNNSLTNHTPTTDQISPLNILDNFFLRVPIA